MFDVGKLGGAMGAVAANVTKAAEKIGAGVEQAAEAVGQAVEAAVEASPLDDLPKVFGQDVDLSQVEDIQAAMSGRATGGTSFASRTSRLSL